MENENELRWPTFKEIPITYVLVIINILVYAILEISGDTTNAIYMLNHGAVNPEYILVNGQWYRLLTAIFLHFGPQHLFNNMLLLFFLGGFIEKAFGQTRYAALYLTSGVGASFVTFLVMLLYGENNISAGASGAIFGLMGGMVCLLTVHKGRYENITLKRVLLMAVLCFYFGLVSTGVDNVGHAAGFIIGLIFSFIIYGIPFIISEIHRKK